MLKVTLHLIRYIRSTYQSVPLLSVHSEVFNLRFVYVVGAHWLQVLHLFIFRTSKT